MWLQLILESDRWFVATPAGFEKGVTWGHWDPPSSNSKYINLEILVPKTTHYEKLDVLYFYHLFIVKRSEIFYQISRSEKPDVTSEKLLGSTLRCPDLMLNQQDRGYKVTRILATGYHLPTQIQKKQTKESASVFLGLFKKDPFPKFEWSLRFVIRNFTMKLQRETYLRYFCCCCRLFLASHIDEMI